MKKVAVSACLLGKKCRYDATDNRNDAVVKKLEGDEVIAFCPEDFAFGSPRPTMDLTETPRGIKALSNRDGTDLGCEVEAYAEHFFNEHPDIALFVGKDRSPSCGVCSAKLYNRDKVLVSDKEAGLMAKEALRRGIESVDAEVFVTHPCKEKK